MFIFVLIAKAADNLNARKGQGSIARGIISLTSRWAKKRREKMRRKQNKHLRKKLSRS